MEPRDLLIDYRVLAVLRFVHIIICWTCILIFYLAPNFASKRNLITLFIVIIFVTPTALALHAIGAFAANVLVPKEEKRRTASAA